MSKQVSAKVIAHSKSSVDGKEIITFELEFPRIVLCEFNTHNSLSKNTSSSRAIPVSSIVDQVRNEPAMPVRFGKKNKGMQDAGTLKNRIWFKGEPFEPEEFWKYGAELVAELSEAWDEAGYAKQVANRWTEVAQRVKVVMTATELNNFYWLRDHPAADPTIEALAQEIKKAHKASTPMVLQPGDWHVPYYDKGYWVRSHVQPTELEYEIDVLGNSLDYALTISASCCAQASFRSLDGTLEKAQRVTTQLNLNGEEPDQPVHASPLEHQGTPIQTKQKEVCNDYGDSKHYFGKDVNQISPSTWEEGITHMDRDGTLCSGNLKGWVQHRQLVPNHVKRG